MCKCLASIYERTTQSTLLPISWIPSIGRPTVGASDLPVVEFFVHKTVDDAVVDAADAAITLLAVALRRPLHLQDGELGVGLHYQLFGKAEVDYVVDVGDGDGAFGDCVAVETKMNSKEAIPFVFPLLVFS